MVRNDMERNGRKGGDQIETERITVTIRHQHLITIYAVYAITFGRIHGCHHLHQLHLLSLGLSLPRHPACDQGTEVPKPVTLCTIVSIACKTEGHFVL